MFILFRLLSSLQCLNLTQLLTYYGLNPDSLISPSQFTYLCPALLYQIDSRVCIRHFHQMAEQQKVFAPGKSFHPNKALSSRPDPLSVRVSQ